MTDEGTERQPLFDFGTISMIVKYAPQIRDIIRAATSNEEIADKIRAVVPLLVDLLEDIGGHLYPNLAPALRLVAGAMATFDPDAVKWLQGALNKYLETDLEVDGEIGPDTIAAVKDAQELLGIDPDGFAGKITYAALAAALKLLGDDEPQPA